MVHETRARKSKYYVYCKNVFLYIRIILYYINRETPCGTFRLLYYEKFKISKIHSARKGFDDRDSIFWLNMASINPISPGLSDPMALCRRETFNLVRL